MRRRALSALALLLSAWLVVPSRADDTATQAPPLDAVRDELAKVDGRARKAANIAETFDYAEMARRALGRHWRDRTHAERAQLVTLVRGHFLDWYTRLCQRQDLLYFERSVVDGNRAVLGARAIRDGHAVSVVYRLRSDTKRWLVYDVEVAGRSHARTLYGEFDRILLNEGYGTLVARVASQQERPTASATR